MATTRFSGVTATKEKVVQGGKVFKIESSTHSVLNARDIKFSSLVDVKPSANINITTPTAEQLIEHVVPVIGDTVSFMYRNSATATYSTTIVAGANVILLEPSGGDVVIAATEWAPMVIQNIDGINVAVHVTSSQDAD